MRQKLIDHILDAYCKILLPAVHRDLAVTHVRPENHPLAAETQQPLDKQLRLARRDTSHDCVVGPVIEQRTQRILALDAAAPLDCHTGPRCHALKCLEVLRRG